MGKIILSHPIERSVLRDAPASEARSLYITGRERLATCAGASWFHGHHLAVVNLWGGHLRVYRFDPSTGVAPASLTLLHEMAEGLSCPTGVAVSRDGSLLAIAHSMSERHGISLHSVDKVRLAPSRCHGMLRVGRSFHGVTFTPDSRYLTFTEVGRPGYIEVVRADTGEPTCRLENPHGPLKPKGVAFPDDGRFIAIVWAPNAAQKGESQAAGGALTVHQFDAERGVVDPEAVAQLRGDESGLGGPESCAVDPSGGGCRILVADQARDVVQAFDFEPQRGALALARPFATGLPFPHGVDVSGDGRFVAITNYGDDSICIAEVVQA